MSTTTSCCILASIQPVQFTITLGEALEILTMLVSVTAIIVGVRVELKNLRADIGGLTERLGKHETTLFTMFGQLQRLIGVVDASAKTPQHVDYAHGEHV